MYFANIYFLGEELPQMYLLRLIFVCNVNELSLLSDVNNLTCVASLMRKLHNSRNYTFANFLVGLLQYIPGELSSITYNVHVNLYCELSCKTLVTSVQLTAITVD